MEYQKVRGIHGCGSPHAWPDWFCADWRRCRWSRWGNSIDAGVGEKLNVTIGRQIIDDRSHSPPMGRYITHSKGATYKVPRPLISLTRQQAGGARLDGGTNR